MEEWMQAWKKSHPFPFQSMPALMVSYDMGWQKQSSGNRYDSHSGHTAAVGCKTRKPIALAVLSKFCWICANGEDTEHDCLKNFDGASGAMEPQALVDLAHDLLDKYYALFGTIVADDDSTMRAQMKWSNGDWMIDNNTLVPPKVAGKDGRLTTRPDKGKLKYPYPEPAFLGDPAHRTKTASGEVFKLALLPLAKSKGVNKIDAIKLKKNYGYMLNQLPNLEESEWENAAKAVLEHHFDCHKYCGIGFAVVTCRKLSKMRIVKRKVSITAVRKEMPPFTTYYPRSWPSTVPSNVSRKCRTALIPKSMSP
jgi:hypothetical protein